MENYEKLLAELRDTASQLSAVYDTAFHLYSKAAEEVLSGRMCDEKQIERLLDGIMDFGKDERFIELMRKLCRHIYNRYPQLVGDYVNMFRLLFEKREESDGDD